MEEINLYGTKNGHTSGIKKQGKNDKLSSYPSSSTKQRKLGGNLPLLPGKSSGAGKGSRDKINELIIAYNKTAVSQDKLRVLQTIIDTTNSWSTKVGKETYTFNRREKEERQTKKLSMIKSLSDELQLELNHLTPMSHDERVTMIGQIREILTNAGIGNAKLKFNANHLNADNARALYSFFQNNPNFLAAFKKHKALNGKLVHVGLDSSNANDYGGGVYTDGNRIYMGTGEGDKNSFMRMFVHETGHASFQQMLYGEGEKDGVPLSDDGHIFYKSWDILKADSANFLGLDLTDNPMDQARLPEGRRKYQQGAFNEFVAESFMHMALEEETLLSHANSIINDPNASPTVQMAWKNALLILDKYKGILLGN